MHLLSSLNPALRSSSLCPRQKTFHVGLINCERCSFRYKICNGKQRTRAVHLHRKRGRLIYTSFDLTREYYISRGMLSFLLRFIVNLPVKKPLRARVTLTSFQEYIRPSIVYVHVCVCEISFGSQISISLFIVATKLSRELFTRPSSKKQ